MSPLQHLLVFVYSIPAWIVNASCPLVLGKLKHKALHIKTLKLIPELPQSKDCPAQVLLTCTGLDNQNSVLLQYLPESSPHKPCANHTENCKSYRGPVVLCPSAKGRSNRSSLPGCSAGQTDTTCTGPRVKETPGLMTLHTEGCPPAATANSKGID